MEERNIQKTLGQNQGACLSKLLVGARLCAAHQPQRAPSQKPAETFHDLDAAWPLRLGCDTAALPTAGQSTTNFGRHRIMAYRGQRTGIPADSRRPQISFSICGRLESAGILLGERDAEKKVRVS